MQHVIDFLLQSGLSLEQVLTIVFLGTTAILLLSVYINYPGLSVFENCTGYMYAFAKTIVTNKEVIGTCWVFSPITIIVVKINKFRNKLDVLDEYHFKEPNTKLLDKQDPII